MEKLACPPKFLGSYAPQALLETYSSVSKRFGVQFVSYVYNMCKGDDEMEDLTLENKLQSNEKLLKNVQENVAEVQQQIATAKSK